MELSITTKYAKRQPEINRPMIGAVIVLPMFISFSFSAGFRKLTISLIITGVIKHHVERLLALPFFLLYCLAFLCFFDAMTEIFNNKFLNLCINKNVLVTVGMKLV